MFAIIFAQILQLHGVKNVTIYVLLVVILLVATKIQVHAIIYVQILRQDGVISAITIALLDVIKMVATK